MSSRVFVIQDQQQKNEEGILESKFDLSSAERFGKLVYLLSPTARPFSPEHVVEALHEKLQDYSDIDHLLLVGNPCIIGFAVAVASDVNKGRVNVLQWSGKNRDYISVRANLRRA